MAEKKFDAQVNYGWGLTLNMTGKAPAVSKRIFSTLADAQAFADDYNDSAIEGIMLSVVADGSNNGVYFVESIKSSADGASAVLTKLGTASGATGELASALEALDVADSAVDGQYVSAVSQTDGRISITRAALKDAVIEEGVTLAQKFESVSEEISAAQEAAEAAATKMVKATDAAHLTLTESVDDTTGAITYTIGESNIASADALATANQNIAANAKAISDEATARENADKALDEKIAANTEAIAALNSGDNSVASQISAAKTELEGKISDVETAYKEADEAIADDLSSLDEAVADFKNKSVGTAISAPGSDEVLPTTKAVVDYVASATNGVANAMTYTAKDGDDTKMELKLIAVDGSTLSTIEMDKENFLSGFVKREATAEDAAADASITAGDPILVVTLVNGDVFRVNLKSLVDVYTGVANQAITTEVEGYVVKATLNIDATANTASAVKLTVGDNGLSAALAIDSTKNGVNGITLAQDGNGLSAALKLDADTIAANGMTATVGANGLSMGIVWTEL